MIPKIPRAQQPALPFGVPGFPVDPLLAAIAADPELYRRVALLTEPARGEPVIRPEALYRVVAPHLLGHEQERLVAVAFDHRRHVLKVETLTIGASNATIVEAKQVFRWALLNNANAIALAHNHPSGDPTPSGPDREVTERIRSAGQMLGVPCVDHLIVANTAWTSMAMHDCWVGGSTWSVVVGG